MHRSRLKLQTDLICPSLLHHLKQNILKKCLLYTIHIFSHLLTDMGISFQAGLLHPLAQPFLLWYLHCRVSNCKSYGINMFLYPSDSFHNRKLLRLFLPAFVRLQQLLPLLLHYPLHLSLPPQSPLTSFVHR